MRHILQNFFAVPAVISARNCFDAQAQKFFRDFRSDTETRSGIFAVGDDQVDLPNLNQIRQSLADDMTAGRANNVTDEQYAHRKTVISKEQFARTRLHLARYTKKERTAWPWAARP